MRRIAPSRTAAACTLVLLGAATTGCTATPGDGAPSGSSSAATSAASATPSPTPTGPALVPDGSAEDNLPLFTSVMERVADTKARAEGRAYIDALVKAGFDKDDMEVTKDLTSVGNPADAIQFSVRWGDECLVGQVGPSTDEPTALVLPLVPGDTCLIGQTRPIDW